MNATSATAKIASFTAGSQTDQQVLPARANDEQEDDEAEQHDLEDGRLEDERSQRLQLAPSQGDERRAAEVPQAAGDDDDEGVERYVRADGRVHRRQRQ